MAASTRSGPEPERISLRQLIQTAAAAYGDGPWEHLIDRCGKLIRPGEAGDTLVDFIIRELGDTYDPDATRAQQPASASAGSRPPQKERGCASSVCGWMGF
jgi:hypothetical protein